MQIIIFLSRKTVHSVAAGRITTLCTIFGSEELIARNHSTMYSTEFLPFVVKHYRHCRKVFKYYPFQFNAKTNRFVKITNRHGRRMFKLLLLVMLGYSTTISLALVSGSLSTAKKVQGVVFALIYILITLCVWNYNLDKAQIQVINSCLDFEDNIMRGIANYCLIIETRDSSSCDACNQVEIILILKYELKHPEFCE
ncbi:hypothetical protein Fcan01_18933 [Folsomia candida]|uniref:Uncharacterized protein n=1 Tax=Folsomia candida TaxID=158441 RepID=A0A226DLF5_FOLCA|nr:hypothetical protein Fcan01_18933 [Folsomia candida]